MFRQVHSACSHRWLDVIFQFGLVEATILARRKGESQVGKYDMDVPRVIDHWQQCSGTEKMHGVGLGADERGEQGRDVM
jgi:hypothetical protein